MEQEDTSNAGNFLAFGNTGGDNQSKPSNYSGHHPYRGFRNQRNFQNNRNWRNRPGFGYDNSNANQNNSNFTPRNFSSPVHRQDGFQNFRRFGSNQKQHQFDKNRQQNNFRPQNQFTSHKKNEEKEFSFESYFHLSMIEDPWKNCGQYNESPFEDSKPNYAQENPEEPTRLLSQEDKLFPR